MSILDAQARHAITHEVDQNIFVEAGAGSGKTTILVARLLTMVKSGIDVSKICAITFTKAAALEFYKRFQARLLQEKKKDDLSAKERGYIEQALKDLDLCFMGTIDAFCSTLLNEHPIEAKVPSFSAVIDDEEREKLYERINMEILNGEYDKVDPSLKEKGLKAKSLFYDDAFNRILLDSLTHIMDSRDSEFIYDEPAQSIDDVLGRKKKEMQDFASYMRGKVNLIHHTASGQADYDKLIMSLSILSRSDWNARLGDIRDALKSVKKLKIQLKSKYEEKISIVEEANALYGKNILIGDKEDGEPNNYIIDGEIVNEIVLPIDAQIAAIVLDYALSIKDIVSEYMRLLGKLTFSDALFYLRDMLKEDAKKEGKLIRHIQNRHAYYLIDEFQDTSPTQSEIFFYLASIEPKEDWMECKPRSGSLFIVGDPKQSIYRFRGADVTSYLRIRKMFEEGGFGKVLLLTRNFRSTNVIRKDFNTFFTGYLEDKEGLQKAYAHVPIDEEIVRDEEVDDFSLKQIQAYEKEREGKENILEGSYIYDIPYYWRNKDNQDPILIANIIEQLVGRSENRIVVKGKDGYVTRHAKYSDFMIITPSTSQIPLIVTELKKRNIPVFVEGKIVYSECPSLVAMTHLYRAACQPKDIHLFLAKYLSDCEIEEESFKEFLYQHTSDTPVSLFVNLMEEYKLYEHVEATNLEYLYYAIQLMRERELDGRILSRKEALAFLEKLLYSRNKEFERYMQFDQEGDRVHIANLHKVKGLERPIVILSGGKSSDFDVVSSFDYSERKPKTYLFGIEKKNNDTGNSEVYLCLGKEEEKEKELLQSEEERKRLIYVAATRAGNVLITARMLDKEGELVPNMMWKDIAEHIHRYIDKAIVIKERELQMDIDREEEDIPLKMWEKEDVLPKEISTYRIVNPSKEKHQLSSKDEEPIVDILEDAKPIQTLEEMRADLFGTLVHAFMEALVNAKGKINQKALIERLIHEYGAEKEIYQTYLEEVAKVICEEGGYKQEGRNIESDIFKTLMDADEVYCEVPFCYKRKGKEKDEIVHGIMDVVYRIGESWHIVDYKTDYDAKGLVKRHSAQMHLYEEALKETMGIEAKAELYHIGIKKAMLEG